MLDIESGVKTPVDMIMYRNYFIISMCACVFVLVIVFFYDMYCAYFMTLEQ
jgi:hypothetical protein